MLCVVFIPSYKRVYNVLQDILKIWNSEINFDEDGKKTWGILAELLNNQVNLVCKILLDASNFSIDPRSLR